MEKGTQSKRQELYRIVFNNSPEGQWVLNDILETGLVGQSLFANTEIAQTRNVAAHDFAVKIKDLAEPLKD